MKRFIKIIGWSLFFIYIFCLSLILFFCRESHSEIPIKEYFALYANAEPLKTLFRYIRYAFVQKDAESIFLALANIGGNLILFLPMGFFLPCLFRNLRRGGQTLCVIAVMIFSSEMLQGIFRIGIPDVDDFFMNILGASAGFFIAGFLNFCEKIPS